MTASKTALLCSITLLIAFCTLGDDPSDPCKPGQKPIVTAAPAAKDASAAPKRQDTGAAEGADYLTEAEGQVIQEINLVRTDPAAYAAQHLEPLRKCYSGKALQIPGETAVQTAEGGGALDECIRELRSAKAIRALSPKKGLTLAARDHARDQARTGATGHGGSDGSSFADRMDRHGKWSLSAAENVGYGSGQARRIVIAFLIDDGVPTRGHRRNLLDAGLCFVGVAIEPHPKYGSVCVVDLAGAYGDGRQR